MKESKINNFKEILKKCLIYLGIKNKNRKSKKSNTNPLPHISKDLLLNMNQVRKINLL
jgi:hypothetical protein